MRNFCLCCPTSVLDPAKLKKEKKKKGNRFKILVDKT